MRMTPAEFATRFPDRAEPLPEEYAGQWVAWDQQRQEILSHGPDLDEVCREAAEAGCEQPILQKVPRAPFVGGA